MININTEHFEDWLRAKGLASRTIKEYLAYINRISFDEFNQDYINLFLSVHDNSICRAFVKNVLLFIQSNDSYDSETKTKAQSYLVNLPKRTGRAKKRLPDFISYKEVLMLANNMRNERDRTMCLLSFTCGLRLSELINLKYKDFNFNEWATNRKELGKLLIIGKGDREDLLFVQPEIMNNLIKYLKETGSRAKDEKVFLISKSTWERRLRDESLRILGKSIHSHTLRHSYCTYLLSKGLDLIQIKKLMRHQNISSTEIYIHLDDLELKKKQKEVFDLK